MSTDLEMLRELAKQPGISAGEEKALADMALVLPGDESVDALRDQAELGRIVREQGSKALQLAQQTEAEITRDRQNEHWNTPKD